MAAMTDAYFVFAGKPAAARTKLTCAGYMPFFLILSLCQPAVSRLYERVFVAYRSQHKVTFIKMDNFSFSQIFLALDIELEQQNIISPAPYFRT